MIKRLQAELGEEAEFDPDQDPHVRDVHREYEQRVEDYEDRNCKRTMTSQRD
jgi:hypothetical protein